VGGVASINTLFDPLTANIPTYMWVSSAPLVNGYTEGKATFALKGGLVNSAANLGGSIGQFNLTFNFDTSLADVSLVASAHQTGGGTRIYTAQGTGLQVGLINSGITIDHISTTSSTGIAGECSAGCETNIAALFSGDHNAQIGAGFHIETMSGTTLAYGVAALNKTSYTAPTPNTIPVLPDSVVDNNPNSLYYYAPAYNVLGAVCSDSGCVVGDINIGMGASFDRSAGANRGSLLTVKQAIDQQGTMVENQSFDRGSLTASNVGKSGDLSWGRLGDGSTSISSAFDNGANNGLSTSRSLIYIVGSSPLSLPATGAAKYSYKGGDNDSGATVNKFDMTFNFDLATVNLDAALQVGSNTVTLRTKDIAGQLGPVGMAFVGGSTLVSASFAIDPTMIQVTDGGSCTAGNNNCVANVKGYFAGAQSSQLGVYYDITGVSLVSKISGVAALDSAGNVLPAPSTIPQPSRGYSVSYSYAGGSGMAAGNDWSGSFGENEITSQRQIFDTNGMLQQSWGEVCVLCDSAVSSVETASRGYTPSTPLAVTPLLNWGRWVGAGVNGSAITVEGVDETLGAGKYLHYITGVATSAAVFQAGTYNNLEATYLFKGGTAATGSDGSTGSIVAGSSIRAVFGSDITQLGLNIGVKMDGSDGAIYRLESGLGTPNSALQVVGSSFNQSNLIVNNAGTGNACASNGCMADINGFFAGQQAQQIGLSYHINDNSIYTPRTVDGVGAFVRPAMTAYNSNNPVD
jgi:hypothetical protein